MMNNNQRGKPSGVTREYKGPLVGKRPRPTDDNSEHESDGQIQPRRQNTGRPVCEFETLKMRSEYAFRKMAEYSSGEPYDPNYYKAQGFQKYKRFVVLKVTRFQAGVAHPYRLLDHFIRLSEILQGIAVFELGKDQYFVFLFERYQSDSNVQKLCVHLVNCAYKTLGTPQCGSTPIITPIDQSFYSQLNAFLGASLTRPNEQFLVGITDVFLKMGFTLTFYLYASEGRRIGTDRGVAPGSFDRTPLVLNYQARDAMIDCTLKYTLIATIQQYFIESRLLPEMKNVGITKFKTEQWLISQEFSSVSSGEHGGKAARAFLAFYRTFDPDQIASLTFDSLAPIVIHETMKDFVQWLHPFLVVDPDRLNQIASQIRMTMIVEWSGLIKDSLVSFMSGFTNNTILSSLQDTNWGTRQRLTSLSQQLRTCTMLPLSELHGSTVASYVLLGRLFLQWLTPSLADNQSLLLQGVAGGGKTTITNILQRYFGFALIVLLGTPYQNQSASKAPGFVSHELDLLTFHKELVPSLKYWADPTAVKSFGVKFGDHQNTASKTPFCTSTNHDWGAFLARCSRSRGGVMDRDNVTRALSRRFLNVQASVVEGNQAAYSNMNAFLEQQELVVLKTILTVGYLCYEHEFTASLYNYELTGLYDCAVVDSQPLVSLFQDLKAQAQSSNDLMYRLLATDDSRMLFTVKEMAAGLKHKGTSGISIETCYETDEFLRHIETIHETLRHTTQSLMQTRMLQNVCNTWGMIVVDLDSFDQVEAQRCYTQWVSSVGGVNNPMLLVQSYFDDSSNVLLVSFVVFATTFYHRRHDFTIRFNKIGEWVAYLLFMRLRSEIPWDVLKLRALTLNQNDIPLARGVFIGGTAAQQLDASISGYKPVGDPFEGSVTEDDEDAFAGFEEKFILHLDTQMLQLASNDELGCREALQSKVVYEESKVNVVSRDVFRVNDTSLNDCLSYEGLDYNSSPQLLIAPQITSQALDVMSFLVPDSRKPSKVNTCDVARSTKVHQVVVDDVTSNIDVIDGSIIAMAGNMDSSRRMRLSDYGCSSDSGYQTHRE